MGAWGFGPFDSDSGLDAVDGLVRFVTVDTTCDDPWEQLTVWRNELRRLLSMREPSAAADVYATVGLVVIARLPTRGPSILHHLPPGDRRAAAIPSVDLGLQHHQETADLLPPGVAGEVMDTARDAMQWLLGLQEWHQSWREPDILLDHLHALALLIPPPPAASTHPG